MFYMFLQLHTFKVHKHNNVGITFYVCTVCLEKNYTDRPSQIILDLWAPTSELQKTLYYT